MISNVFRDKRKIVTLSVLMFSLIGGFTLLDYDIENTGSFFMFSFLIFLTYFLTTWLLKKKKIVTISPLWVYRETQILSFLVAILNVFAIIECYEKKYGIIVFFILLLISIIIFIYMNYRIHSTLLSQTNPVTGYKIIPIIAYWLFAIGGGIILITLENLHLDEVTAIVGFFYFALLFYWGISWTIKQIKSVINLKKEKAKTELMHLKSQVNPHFFFNMLNNLYGWVDRDSKTAKELILKLSDMMRYSIYDGQKDEVTLEEEVEYLKNYIELHKMRYHKKISVHFKINILKEEYMIMPLLFIILIENAFKHGVENLREKQNPFVNIDLSTKGNNIIFSVENNFDKNELAEKPGIGLQNLKRRLELVYKNKYSYKSSVKNDVYKAELTLKQI